MPADAIARAVALHGLGKMTIHDGEFKKGLSLMEQSVAEYPLALAYRNLAVYWNSEGDLEQGNAYTQKALALEPKDPYNIVFAAVFMAASGRGDEALKIARANREPVAGVVQPRCDLRANWSAARGARTAATPLLPLRTLSGSSCQGDDGSACRRSV